MAAQLRSTTSHVGHSGDACVEFGNDLVFHFPALRFGQSFSGCGNSAPTSAPRRRKRRVHSEVDAVVMAPCTGVIKETF